MVLKERLSQAVLLVLLGGSWVVISGFVSKVTILITQIRGLITPLITTHEPPSNGTMTKMTGSQALKLSTQHA